MSSKRAKTSATEEPFGEMNIKQANRKVFLVKLPAYVAKEWDNLRPNTEIGRVLLPEVVFEDTEVVEGNNSNANEIRETKKRKRATEERKLKAVTGKLVLTTSQLEKYPKDHTLFFAPSPVPTFAFTETDQGQVTLEGNVPSRWDCRPDMTKEYRSVLQSREDHEKKRHRPLITITEDQAPKTIHQRSKVRKAEPIQDKMTRIPKPDLINAIFHLFSTQEHWSLKSLRDSTEQPTAYLKEVLQELCVYTKKGPNKNTFELKPEYKGTKKEETTGAQPKKEK